MMNHSERFSPKGMGGIQNPVVPDWPNDPRLAAVLGDSAQRFQSFLAEDYQKTRRS